MYYCFSVLFSINYLILKSFLVKIFFSTMFVRGFNTRKNISSATHTMLNPRKNDKSAPNDPTKNKSRFISNNFIVNEQMLCC